MNRLWFCVLVANIFSLSAAAESLPTKFSCSFSQALGLEDDGKLVQTKTAKWWRDALKGFVFDAKTGQMTTTGSASTIQFDVLQQGTSINGLVAVYAYQGPAAYVLEVLKIKTYRDSATNIYPFTFDDDSFLYSGTCVAR